MPPITWGFLMIHGKNGKATDLPETRLRREHQNHFLLKAVGFSAIQPARGKVRHTKLVE